jgi:hypothetical protein
LERYQALLSQWFREEPALEYDSLTGEEAEHALQALMNATIEIGLQHLGKEIMEDVSRWMESQFTGITGTPAVHRRVDKSLR